MLTVSGVKGMDQAQIAYLHFRAGTLDEDVYESRIRSYCSFLENTPLVKQLWPSMRDYPVPSFAAMIETRVGGFPESALGSSMTLFE